jgi:hypothetical protein
MKLTLERTQENQTMGKPLFVISAQVELSEKENRLVDAYKLKSEPILIMERADGFETGKMAKNLFGQKSMVGNWVAGKNENIIWKAGDLIDGTTIECESVLSMLDTEEEIKTAAQKLKMILVASSQFGGRETVSL